MRHNLFVSSLDENISVIVSYKTPATEGCVRFRVLASAEYDSLMGPSWCVAAPTMCSFGRMVFLEKPRVSDDSLLEGGDTPTLHKQSLNC
jgi:hypothetical protein